MAKRRACPISCGLADSGSAKRGGGGGGGAYSDSESSQSDGGDMDE
jgi:hypothetical protein